MAVAEKNADTILYRIRNDDVEFNGGVDGGLNGNGVEICCMFPKILRVLYKYSNVKYKIIT